MNTKLCMDTLRDRGVIPQDAEVVSTNNKVVTVSRALGIVSRISDLDFVKSRDDPHNLDYSHRVSWLAGESGAVVRPTQEEPEIYNNYLVSSYPLLKSGIDLGDETAEELSAILEKFGNSLPVVEQGIDLRTMNVATYVRERLDSMQGNAPYNQERVDYLTRVLNYLEEGHPFEQLTLEDPALVHGDLKADNVVRNALGRLQMIDLDAAAVGPRYFDIASWRLRTALGDKAPIEQVADIWRKREDWDEDTYRALIGWKALSSMSFTMRYEATDVSDQKVHQLAASARTLAGTPALQV